MKIKYIVQMQCLPFKSFKPFAYYKSKYISQIILGEGGFSVAYLIIN